MAKKILKTSLIALLIFILPFTSFAVERLSLNKAVNLAQQKDNNRENLDDTVDDLWENYQDLVDAREAINDQLDAIEEYQELYEKKYEDNDKLDAEEQQKLLVYQQIFGDKPPSYTEQEIYENFIKPAEFPYYQVRMEIEKLKNQRDLVDKSIEMAVKDLYINVLNLRDLFQAQKEYENNLKEQYKDDQLKYELGQISEVELKESEINYKKKVYANDDLERQLTILELNLKKTIGFDLYDELELTSKLLLLRDYELEEYSYYEEKALQNRLEVLNAEFDYKRAKREAELTREYLRNPLLTDRLTYDSNEIDAKNALESAKKDVSQDVYTAYFDTLENLEEYHLKIKKYRKAINDFTEKREMYNLGYLDENTFNMIKFSYKMAKIDLMMASRSLDLSYEKLMNATGLGPGYTSNNMGGSY